MYQRESAKDIQRILFAHLPLQPRLATPVCSSRSVRVLSPLIAKIGATELTGEIHTTTAHFERVFPSHSGRTNVTTTGRFLS